MRTNNHDAEQAVVTELKKTAKAPAKRTKRTPVRKTPVKRAKKATRSQKTPKTLKVVSVITKKNPFKKTTLRHKKWACIRDGAKVSEIVAAMRAKGLRSPRTFVANCVRMGHLRIDGGA